jgi:hypothetical protein
VDYSEPSDGLHPEGSRRRNFVIDLSRKPSFDERLTDQIRMADSADDVAVAAKEGMAVVTSKGALEAGAHLGERCRAPRCAPSRADA